MTCRTAATALLLPLAILACARGVPQAPDPHVPRAGLWDVRLSVGEIRNLSLTPEQWAEAEAHMNSSHVARQCFSGRTPEPGQTLLAGRCTYSRIADDGPAVSRTATCHAPEPDLVDTIEISGTRSSERYDHRILTLRTDAATGRLINSIETREQGRWIGPCPALGPD